MRRARIWRWLALLLFVAGGARVALAHITPPVILISDREAVVGMLSGAKRFFVREVRLSAEEKELIRRQRGWRPEEDFYRFYLGRDEKGQLVAAVTFLTEFTIHGPVRVAVGLGPDGKVKDAKVVELTEETFPWLKPLLDQHLTRDYIGRDSRASFAISERFERAHLESMPHFYAQIVASLIQRGAILYEVTILKRGGAA
ncbi:MAG: hypothetical protein ACK4Z6_07295 [Candidatus Methylomirabilales bacterium]